MTNNNKKYYIPFDIKSTSGYPTGKNLFYECTKCGDILPSWPSNCISCSCKNIFIDIDAGRLIVKDHKFFKIFLEEKKK